MANTSTSTKRANIITTQPADASDSDVDTKFEAEIKAQRVFALLIAARECAQAIVPTTSKRAFLRTPGRRCST